MRCYITKFAKHTPYIFGLLLVGILAACSQVPQPQLDTTQDQNEALEVNETLGVEGFFSFPHGSGFTQKQVIGQYASLAVEFADFNNDGFLDAWIVQAGGTSQVYFNSKTQCSNMTDNFVHNQYYMSYKAKDVALGDVDNDGDIDAWVVGGTGSYLYTNDGSGHFSNQPHQISSIPSDDVEFADFNQDGRVDAWVTNTNQDDTVYINSSTNGQLGLISSSVAGTQESHNTTLHDVDGDGDIDAWVITPFHHIVFSNQGSGIFTQAQTLFYQAWGAKDVALGDVNGDGAVDAWVAQSQINNNAFTQPNRLFLGTPNHLNFTYANITLGNSDSRAIRLADVDKDGDLDVLVANVGANTLYTNSSGIFTIASTYGGYQSTNMAVADIDNTGDVDVLFTNEGMGYGAQNQDRLYLNNYNRTSFTCAVSIISPVKSVE